MSLYLIPPNVASWWRSEAGSSSSGSSWWRCPWSFLLFLFHVEPRSTITPLLATFSTVPRSSSFEISSSITGSYGSIGGKPRGVSTANCLRRWLNRSRNRERGREKERQREREINKGREREKEKERVRLDIARGSVQYWRTSSWPTTVATPASLGFLLSSYLCLSLAFVPPRTGALPKFHEIHVDVVKKTCLSARLSLILRPGWLKFNFVSIVVVWGYVSELGRWRLERTVADTSCGIRELKRKQCCLLKIVMLFVWINFLLQVESTVYLLLQNEKFVYRIEWVVRTKITIRLEAYSIRFGN